MTLPQGANQRWSLDFVSDVLADGRRFRVLVVVDDFTRECLALVVDTSISGRRVARELDAIAIARRKPLMIVINNGTVSRSRTLSSRASTGASATSASTSTCSVACRWHGGSLKPGGSITMPAGRTPASAV